MTADRGLPTRVLGASALRLLCVVLLAAWTPTLAVAGWAGLTKYLYGPNEDVVIDVGFIDFYPATFSGQCTYCPPPGQCDSWAGVNITALIYIVESGAVSGTEEVALTPLQVIPPHQVVQPSSTSGFIDEVIAQTGPTGPLHPGTYDVIFDECENHRFDPDKDAIVATFMVGYVNIEFMNPNPELMSGGQIISDWNTLGAYVPTPEVNKLVADGVTRLVLRVADLPDSGSVTFRLQDDGGQSSSEIGELSEVGGGGGGSEVSVSTHLMPDDSYAAFAVLTGPLDFVPAAGGETSPSRAIQIEAEYEPDNGGTVPPGVEGAILYRPPVVLIHGLWSSSSTWGWSIKNDPRFMVVHTVDYSSTNAAHFSGNVDKPRQGVRAAVDMMRLAGIAATQADVFGHSMGGVLSRMYVGGSAGDYIRDDNFREGDIHKLITVDSPHNGSPWAYALVDEYGASTFLGRILNRVGLCTDCGAVYDLRPDSAATAGMPSADVPAHAIVGKGGSDAIQMAIMSAVPGYPGMVLTILDFFDILEDIFPPGMQHDAVVGRLSQEDGLGGSQTSVFGLELGVSWGLHTTVTGESVVSDRAGELLDAGIESGSEFGSGFSSSPSPLPEPLLLPAFEARDDAIAITSPGPGETIEPGSPLTVVVEPVGGYVPTRVMVVCEQDAVVDEEAPFELELDIPVEAIGDLTLTAYAFDPNEVLAESAPVSVSVAPSASLTGLSVTPYLLYLYGFAPTQQLVVTGQFDDGVSRDMTSAALGTTYESADECRLTVSADGLLTGRHSGSVTVTVANGAQQRTAYVHIVSAPGDFDEDGDIDLADLSRLLASYGKCAGDAEFYSDADFDDSGCVELSDLGRLLAAYGTGCP